MSWNPSLDTDYPPPTDPDVLETLIFPRARDIGDFEVRRALPSPKRKMVGPFIFFDQAGPAEFVTGKGIDVRPHPHIGLGTVTYLFKGEFQHRDSLGTNQIIHPGAVNWMIAGKGVTHSERTSAQTRQNAHSLFGIQTWIALPESHEQMDADFEHHPKQTLPFLEAEGKELRLILGSAYGETAPAKTFSEMFYADVLLEPHAHIPLPDDHEDRGIYILSGSIEVAGQSFSSGQMLVFRPGDKISLKAGAYGAQMMILGGETLNGPRYIWWNFVASSKDLIEEAKEAWAEQDWESGRFQLPAGDEEEFVIAP